MNELNSQVLESLKCPACFRYMSKPIYQCETGHSICKECSRANHCLLCRRRLTLTRNYSLESISAKVKFPCHNETRGCYEHLTMQELEEHGKICDFRSYSCKLDDTCTWKGKRSELKKHYVEKHDDKVLIGNECFFLWKQDKPHYTVNMMLAFDERFYVHRKLKKDVMYWVVQYIGAPEDVILFNFEINIFTDQFVDRRIIFSEICHDDTKDVDEIIDNGFCAAVPMHILDTYVNSQDAIFYKIKISQT